MYRNQKHKLEILVSAYDVTSSVIAWLWCEFKVKTGRHVNKTIYIHVGCDFIYTVFSTPMGMLT
jgi:hypothetical protein